MSDTPVRRHATPGFMIFDLLCKIVDKYIPSARPWMHEARLFDFPYRSHEVLPKGYTPEQEATLNENFFLPFHAVAIEDTASVIVLVDSEPEQRGLDGTRYFIEALPIRKGDADEFRPEDRDLINADVDKMADMMPPDTVTVTVGKIGHVHFDRDTNQFRFDGSLALALMATPDRLLINLLDEKSRTQEYLNSGEPSKVLRGQTRMQEEEAMAAATMRNVAIAVQEVMYLNTPNRFIVEDTPKTYLKHEMRMQAKKRRKQDPATRRVLRSDERPTYILLTPEEIREQFNFPTHTGTTKRAHERRRHMRTYPDDPARFPNAHGKTIIVPASWIGPSELKTATRRYRVMLDI